MNKATSPLLDFKNNKKKIILLFLAGDLFLIFSIHFLAYFGFPKLGFLKQILYSALLLVTYFNVFLFSGWITNKVQKSNNLSIMKQAVAFIISTFVLLSLVTFVLLQYFLPDVAETSILKTIEQVLICFVFPAFVLLILADKYHRSGLAEIKSNENKQTNSVEGNSKKENQVTIHSDTKKSIRFVPEQLIYMEAEQNYVSFYIKKEEKIKKEMLRMTMKKVEQEITALPIFFRCHNSFIVNRNYIQNIRGNSKGYRLDLQFIDQKIPVSRNIDKNILEEIRSQLEL
jgi:hypothetical protein